MPAWPRRLDTDYIDLYQLDSTCPLTRSPLCDALDQLVTDGKIRGYGWSTDDPAKARIFAERQHCIAVQFTLNVLETSQPCVRSATRPTSPDLIADRWRWGC